MILPQPSDLKKITQYPLTLTLALLNVFIFVLIFSGNSSSLSNSALLQEDGLELSGRLYYQYLKELPPQDLFAKPQWIHEMHADNLEQMGVLGAYALRDADFLKVADQKSFRGDEVQVVTWKKEIVEFRKEYKEQLLFRFGLSSLERGPLSWITYQFSHSNWMHLLSNLMFLVVIGAAVEGLVGSSLLLMIYLLGGLAGGAGFLISQGPGTVPMVGASASISALLAFYCVAELRPRVRYFYFISPMPGHNGFIYLPTLMILPLFLVVDLANLWSAPEGLGSGVAYAAHLGGTVFGLLSGYIYRVGRERLPVITKH